MKIRLTIMVNQPIASVALGLMAAAVIGIIAYGLVRVAVDIANRPGPTQSGIERNIHYKPGVQ